MIIEIGNKPLKEMSAEDLRQIVIIEGACPAIEYNGEEMWNEPVITGFDNTMFSDTLVLDYTSYRKRDGLKSADYSFFFDIKRFSWHLSRDYEKTRKQDGEAKRVSIEVIKYLIAKGYDVPVYGLGLVAVGDL
jgi:hypothetical protein